MAHQQSGPPIDPDEALDIGAAIDPIAAACTSP
jgi:hypothetical protein